MRDFLGSLWAIVRALGLGLIGQPEGGLTPQDRQADRKQRARAAQAGEATAGEALETLAREATLAAIGQPSDGEQDRQRR